MKHSDMIFLVVAGAALWFMWDKRKRDTGAGTPKTATSGAGFDPTGGAAFDLSKIDPMTSYSLGMSLGLPGA